MRRIFRIWLCAVFVLLVAGLPAGAQRPATLTSVAQVTALSNAQAAQSLPVKFEAIVTFPRPSEKNLFVMEGNAGCYVRWQTDQGLLPGDRIEITGVTAPSFRPIVVASQVHFKAHGPMPTPQPAKFEDLIQAKWDSRYVEIEGHVLSAAMDDSRPYHSMRVRVKVPNGTVEGIVAHPGTLRAEDLLDADVRMTGVAGGEYDSKMQMAGMWLDMNSWKDLVILHQPSTDPWSAPAISMDGVIGAFRYSNLSRRVRITGTLTYYEPGTLAVLEQEHGHSMLVKTSSTLPLHAGGGVEATGFPAVSDETVRLDDAALRPVLQGTQTQPSRIYWEDASVGKFAYNLVSMEGEIVAIVHDSRVDLFIVSSEGHLFSATLRHSSSDALLPSDNRAPEVGSRVRVTGVCFVDTGNHWRDRLWFDLRMRSLQDIIVLQQPSWWTVKKLAYLTTLLSFAILMAVIWVGQLDRRLRTQTAIVARQSQEDAIRERGLARQEQQRSHILELISSSVPLPEVLREIQSMVSSRLYGSSCWFELTPAAGGATELHRPTGPEIVYQELLSHEGVSLGLLLTTPLRVTDANSEAISALTAGARLAELAIETRRLYTDLRHRSEHDLLTDIPNRFSMEKHLDRLMSRAMRKEGIFGLIYVDLDRFKQVNDRYGHNIGDLYLQEVTRRMKLQLRTDDVLARIGGDEFIALVSILRNRTDAEEIATRLEHCFDEPFKLEDHILIGSASVGLAVYPEDGISKEELQRAADAAMYANKEFHKRQEKRDVAMQGVLAEDLRR